MTVLRTNPADPLSVLIDEDSLVPRGGGYEVDLRSLTSPEVVVVRDADDLDDLPRNGDVIYLEPGKTYRILGTLNLGGITFIVTGSNSFIGSGAETTFMITDSAQPLVVCQGAAANLNVELITLRNDGGPVVFFDELTPSAPAERTLSCLKVNFTGSGTVITYQDAAFALLNECAWLGCSGVGVLLDREILGCVVDNSASRLNEDNFVFMRKPATCTISSRIRLTLSSIDSPTGGYGLDVDATGIGDERLFVVGVNFNGSGDAIFPGSVGPDSTRAYFKTNLGVESTYPRAAYSMTTPASVSATQNVPIKLGGVTTGIESQLFDFPANNRARYVGSKPRRFLASATVTIDTVANNQTIRLNFAVDGVVVTGYTVAAVTSGAGGTRREAMPLNAVLNLDPGSYVELWVTDETSSTDVTWSAGDVILTEIGG